MIARIYALLARVKETNDISISWTPSHTKEDSPSREGMRQRTYLLREDVQPLLYSAPLHGVRAPPLLAPLVDPRLTPCCGAPKACGGPPVKTPVYPRLKGDNPLYGVRFFCN